MHAFTFQIIIIINVIRIFEIIEKEICIYIYILPINTVVTRFQNSRRKRSEPRLIADRIIRNRISGGKREQLAKLPRSESNTRTTESRGFTLARFCSVESGTLIERAHRWKIVFTEHTEES